MRYKEKPVSGKQNYTIVVDGQSFDVHLAEKQVRVGEHTYSFEVEERTQPVQPVLQKKSEKSKDIVSPIMGTLTAVLVKEGQEVKADQPLFKIEVMKMETEIKAPSDGIILEVLATKGASVAQGQVLARSA